MYFKHGGVAPEARQWFRVVDNTRDHLDECSQDLLAISFADLESDMLLVNATAREGYRKAKEHWRADRHKEALEELAKAAFLVLRGFPGIIFPVLGEEKTEHALMVSTFGVNPSDFLSLQGFLPRVVLDDSRVTRRSTGNYERQAIQAIGLLRILDFA